MTSPTLIVVYLTVWAVLMRGLAVAVRPGHALCARCGRPAERQRLGDPVCRCHD